MISNRSMSSILKSAFAKAFLVELIGPMPITSGATPVVAVLMTRAIIGTPSALALSSAIRITPEAASFMPDALPAVTLPPSLKDGFRRDNFSIVVSGLGYSSVA